AYWTGSRSSSSIGGSSLEAIARMPERAARTVPGIGTGVGGVRTTRVPIGCHFRAGSCRSAGTVATSRAGSGTKIERRAIRRSGWTGGWGGPIHGGCSLSCRAGSAAWAHIVGVLEDTNLDGGRPAGRRGTARPLADDAAVVVEETRDRSAGR